MAVVESSQPSAARQLAREAAETAGFGEKDAYRAGIVASEMATNLLKHARGGEFLARAAQVGESGEIELLALDRGPGIADIAAAMAYGTSSAGSSGNGLGAVRRLSDAFDLFSDGRGTAVLARLRRDRKAPNGGGALLFAGVSVAMAGQDACGDAWHVRDDGDAGAVALVVDGLGHGLHAFEAAAAAVSAFRHRRHVDGREALRSIHDGTRHTRGAAAAVATVDRPARVMRYSGVGNISAAVVHDGTARHAVSHNGTLGHEARTIREYTYPWSADAILVMHSDGLATHWSLDSYRGLRQRHPALVAAILYRDYSRGRDDVTVVVGREP